MLNELNSIEFQRSFGDGLPEAKGQFHLKGQGIGRTNNGERRQPQ
jgi:hypothetical protein